MVQKFVPFYIDKLLYKHIEAIDASSVYDLFNFVCDPIRRVS